MLLLYFCCCERGDQMCDQANYDEKIIEHLSSEITTQSGYLMTFRSRIAFTILIGPFVLLGSFMIAVEDGFKPQELKLGSIIAIAIACVCYVGIGGVGGFVDWQVTHQCNEWRRQISSIRRGTADTLDMTFEHTLIWVYIGSAVIVLFAFLSIVYLLSHIMGWTQ